MNLHTFAIAKMKEDCTVEKRFQSIIQTLDTAYRCLEDLMDDPIFLDTIHGDQELALDQALELIDNIKYSFEPEYTLPLVTESDRFGNADVS
ncbi:MAG: hypothetical protein DWQ21_04520 [Bacteroidetes bacterium]|jgi:hypothetical protein|nr:MAG: hypothetical protein DWQ21_04520 [Bacteroidota bacterium]REK52404.1 MAG: hypothetical protein DWQ49_13165 [Bacteroidota bacterium]|tara:strand:- start:144 stop:419 length:276 start_codon:yes stop_codon:yes gene_type:complete